MGFWSSLFGGADIENLLNPISGMKMREFVIADDDPGYLKHYFRFTNREGNDEEFIVVYSERIYARTHWRRVGFDPEFCTLNDHSPWSPAISHLINLGNRLSAHTRPTRGHFASSVSPGELHGRAVTAPSSQMSPKPPPNGDFAGRSVQANDWQVRALSEDVSEKVQKYEISRSYQFAGLSGTHTHATLRVIITLEGEIVPGGLSLSRKLRFYLWPFQLPHDVDVSMRLMTTDRTQGGTFSVLASPVDGDSDTAVIARFAGKDDVTNCLAAIMSGKPLQFNLSAETETLVGFELPSDQTFEKVYQETCERMASPHNGKSEESGPDMAEVRGNPKGYAVWLVEEEYGVFLMKLNAAGDNLEDGWCLGKFPTRDEQGNFGLKVARDLHIQLMDVVKNS
jgi:hypothetical protein